MALSYQNTKRVRLMRTIKKLPGLVFYHPLSEISGTVAHNYAPGNLGKYNTNLNGTFTSGVAGRIGRGCALDGASGFCDLPSNAAFGGLSGCTIIVNNALTSGVSAFEKPFFKNGVYDFGINTGGSPFVEIVGIFNKGAFSANNFYDNTSHLMVITETAGTLATYIDGTQASSNAGTVANTASNTNDIAYGKNLGNGSEYVKGTIQHYAFLSQGITAGQYRKLAHVYGYI